MYCVPFRFMAPTAQYTKRQECDGGKSVPRRYSSCLEYASARARLSSMFYELRNGKAKGTNERTRERRIEFQLVATRTRHTWGRARGRATPTGAAWQELSQDSRPKRSHFSKVTSFLQHRVPNCPKSRGLDGNTHH